MPRLRTAKARHACRVRTRVRTRARDGSGERRIGSGHLDMEVAGPVAEQVLEVLIAGRLPQGGADQQVPDPGTAQVEGETGVQLVPGPGRERMPAGVAEQVDEHRER